MVAVRKWRARGISFMHQSGDKREDDEGKIERGNGRENRTGERPSESRRSCLISSDRLTD